MKWVAVAILLLSLAGGVVFLRETTMTQHRATPVGSTTRVSFEVATNGTPGNLRVAADALVRPCVLDVTAEVAEPLHRPAGERFVLVLRPALDDDETQKFRGCLADWRVPHVLAREIVIEDRGLPGE